MTQSAIIQYLSFRNPICLAPAWTCSASHLSRLVKGAGIKLCVDRNYYKIVEYTSHVSYYVSVSYILQQYAMATSACLCQFECWISCRTIMNFSWLSMAGSGIVKVSFVVASQLTRPQVTFWWIHKVFIAIPLYWRPSCSFVKVQMKTFKLMWGTWRFIDVCFRHTLWYSS